MLKKIALAAMILCGVAAAQNVTAPATLDPGQIYTTGNLVQTTTTTSGSTWVNGVYQDQLTCWAWGDPGYCGPNAIVRPGNNINFSFGTTDLYQIQSISSVLPGSGSGLRVNGYNFGFTAKNGNGWDGGGLDALSAYVSFYGSDNKLVRNDYYDLNYQFNWTTFNYSKNFDSPYAASDLSTVRYGFVGRDNNFWAGPYGPEVINVSFNLKYSVDPCATNPLYSPSCPGYMDALSKLLPPASAADSTSTASTSSTPTATVTVETVADPVSPVVTVTTTPSTTTVATSTTTAASPSTPTTASRESAPSNTSLALSIISRNQQREQAIAAQAVQTATSTAAAAAAASQQEAAAVAAQAVANSTSSVAMSGFPQQSLPGMGLRITSSAAQSISLSASPALQASTATAGSVGPISSGYVQSTSSVSLSLDSAPVATSNILLDRTNPINQIIESTPSQPQSNLNTTTGPVVNRNTANNEAAGGVDLTKMAIAPTGYNDYLNFALRDAAFYAPREVYRNQRTIDNARALRQLSSDKLHQDMVEQQYRRAQ